MIAKCTVEYIIYFMENYETAPAQEPLPEVLRRLDGDMDAYLARTTVWRKLGRGIGNAAMHAFQGSGVIFAPGFGVYARHTREDS